MKKNALLFALILVINPPIFGQYSQTTTSEFNYNDNFNISTLNDELKLTNDVGTGVDGDLYVAPGATVKVDQVKTYVVGENPSGQNAIQIYSTNGFEMGDEVLIITMRDNNSNLNNNIAGQHELGRVLAILTNALILEKPLVNEFSATDKTHQVIKVPNYNNVTIDYGGIITCDDWDPNSKTGGIICFKVKNILIINTLAKIDASKKGYLGASGTSSSGTGIQGESILGFGGNSFQNNVNAGGGGGYAALGISSAAAGGGGGSYGTDGTYGCHNYDMYGDLAQGGYSGATTGSVFLTKLLMGGSGGGGGRANNGTSGKGGNGGGIIYISCDSLYMAGMILCNGEDGSDVSGSSSSGGGGGGAGGSIYINAAKSVNCGNLFIKAIGGQGGNSKGNVCGGIGGKGIIRIDAPLIIGYSDPSVGYSGTNYASSGYSITPVYILQDSECWSSISFNKNTAAPGTSVIVDLLNSAGALLVPNISSGSLINVTNDSIRIKISLSTTYPNQSPLFYDWTVITSTAPPAELIPSGPTQFCEGESVTLNANTGTGYSYQWFRNGTLINGVTGPTYNATQSGIYKVVITEDCSATSNPVNIVVYPLPVAFAGNDLTVCAGQSVTLSATGGVSYVWNNGVVQDISFIPQATSVYLVTVTDANGCIATDNVMITVNPVPPAPFITLNGNVLMSDAPIGNQWYRDGVLIPGATNQTYEHASTGTFFDIVTLYGCSSDTSNVLINTWIGENGNAFPFIVYPNPSSNDLFIESELISEFKEWKIMVFTIEGQFITGAFLKAKNSRIDISGLSNGIYFLKFENEESVLYQKFIKN